MAFVALQIDNDKILVASAKVAAKRMQVSHLFSVQIDGDDAQAGANLKKGLASHGLSRSDAIIVVSRADAEMRELSLPPAPNNELPDMVRFIARSEFATLNESWALDYVPMSDDEKVQRTVLAAGISPELQSQINTIVDPSGLRVKHIVLRPYASLGLIHDKVNDDVCRLIVDPNGDTTDMTIAKGNQLLATRTVRIPVSHNADQRADSLLSEVRRTLASSRKILADEKVAKVFVFGPADQNKMLEGNLQSHLELETEFVNPLQYVPSGTGFKEPEMVERYAALLGALAENAAGKRHAIDFVNPRRPIVKKADFKKWYLYGGLAAAAAIMAVVLCFYSLAVQDSTLTFLRSESKKLSDLNDGDKARKIPSVEQVISEVERIDSWVTSDVNWLEEIYQYSNLALTPDDAIVDLFDASASTRNGSAPKVTVNTRLADIPKESEMVESLSSRPFIVDPSRGGRDDGDEEYPLSSTFKVSLIPNANEKLTEIKDRAERFVKKRNAELMGKVNKDQ